MPEAAPAPGCAGLTVLFDGACPLCRREIGLYRNLTPRQPLQWLDLSQPQTALPPQRSRQDFLARFHVQQADGRLLSGAEAFVALWLQLPGWRWLGHLGRLPGMTAVMEGAYRGFLHLRPALQGVARAFEPLPLPADLVAELRSDHAGETGAVWIYRGTLAVARNRGVRDFAARHLATEKTHLALIAEQLPWPRRSLLLPGWRVAGFLTGALPALLGPRAVYATIAAVETFVDTHYQQQIDRLAALHGPTARPEHAALTSLLRACQADECAHRDEARAAAHGCEPRGLLRAWCAAVGRGSALAVQLARRL